MDLAAVLQPRPVSFEDLRGRALAVDAATDIYPFLALLRGRAGNPLADPQGRVTSHLNGLLMKLARLRGEFDVRPFYVFDGPPSPRKRATLAARRAGRDRAEAQRREALARGDEAAAFAKAVSATRLTRDMVLDARRLLDLLGVPWMEAPADAEAQCAALAARGRVWAAASKDFDSLLYGAPRLVRFLSLRGQEWLPSQGRFRAVPPEVLELAPELQRLGLTRPQLVEAALLVGTDFLPGVRGYGPVKAVQALRAWGGLAAAPVEVRAALGEGWEEVRDLFLHPPARDLEVPPQRPADAAGTVAFLVGERGFQEARVRAALARLGQPRSTRLDDFG